MSRQPFSPGPIDREAFRRALGSNSGDLTNHGLIPAAPDMQIPGVTIPFQQPQDESSSHFHAPIPNATYGMNNPYLQTHNVNNMASFGGSPLSGNRNSGYGNLNQQYVVNQLNSPVYQDHSDNTFAPLVGQPVVGQGYIVNSPATDSDSEDEGAHNNAQVFQGIIRNEQHYQDTTIRRGRKGSQNIQANDIPDSEDEKLAMVKELFESIIDTSNVVDKPSKDGKPAQAVRRFRSGFYSSKEIEMKCWEILIRCRDATLGIKLPGLDSKAKREEYVGFRTRFNKIVESCRMSKALCKQIMDPSYINRLVAAPGAEIQMKFNNKKINAERDIQNEIGRKAVKRGINLNDLDRLVSSDAPSPASPIDPALTDLEIHQLSTVGAESYLAANQQSGNEAAQIAGVDGTMGPPKTPKTPANAVIQQKPAYTASTTPSSSKRKRGTSTVLKNQITFEDSDSDSEYTETPSKRRRSGTKLQSSNTPSRRPGSGRRPVSGMSDRVNKMTPSGPLMTGTASMHLDSSSPVGQSAGLSPVGQFSSPSAAVQFSVPPPVDQPSSPSPAFQQFSDDDFDLLAALEEYNGQQLNAGPGLHVDGDELGLSGDSGLSLEDEISEVIANGSMFKESLEMYYKDLLCDLLQVDRSFGTVYSLLQLRVYARAFNRQFEGLEWNFTPEYHCFGFTLFKNNGVYVGHFAQELSVFGPLAIARGDMTEAGVVNKGAEILKGFPTQTDPEIQRALGIAPNDFGIYINAKRPRGPEPAQPTQPEHIGSPQA